MEKHLSLRANRQLLALFLRAQEYQPLFTRVDVFNEAVNRSLAEKVDYKKLSNMKLKYPINGEGTIPEFIQLKTDKEQWDTLVDRIKTSFTPKLSKITIPYVVKLVLLNYVMELESSRTKFVSEEEKCVEKHPTYIENVSLPDMAKTLVQMVLEDRECAELKDIEKIMLDWRNK